MEFFVIAIVVLTLLKCGYDSVKLNSYYKGYRDGYKKGYRYHMDNKKGEENRFL
jgi:hypothetical protein